MFTAAGYEELKEKIDSLNRIAWEVRISDSNKAFIDSKEAVELSRKINYEKGLADGLCVGGFSYIRRSDFDKASFCLNEAQTIYMSLNDLRGLASVNEYFGIIERNKGNSGLALEYILKALQLSRVTGFSDNEVTNLYQAGVTYRSLADYEKALDYLYQSLSLARSVHFSLMEAYNLHVIGSIYFETEDHRQALEYYKQGLPIRKAAGDKWGEAGSLDNIGFTYLKLKDYVQAIEYCKASLAITKNTGDKKGQANALFHLAEAHKQKEDVLNALKHSDESLAIRQSTGDRRGEVEILLFLAGFTTQSREEIFDRLASALKIAGEINTPDLASKIHFQMYEYFKQSGLFEKALEHLELHINLEKQLHKDTINQKILNFEIVHRAETIKKEAENIRVRNEALTKLNNEIEAQRKKIEVALTELKSTQAQLIQSEKMASLGELTAGIAHEIQNPLNFVNNFSEVNKELIEELKEERHKAEGERDTAVENEILNDIDQNLDKISFHGKRADAIVKGMLQHSRVSTGQKEPTDINALCDEYLRLSYHGLRAKDKSFNTDFKTDFDDSIGKINIVPQDIGRVLLNLFNNAFYAVNEKSKNLPAFVPAVAVVTKKLNDDKVEIIVKDNGKGIPQNIIDKIFQPFFTTKPTGQGTGLGLSLAYDIIKSHDGEIKVETPPDGRGEGSKFIIRLPT